MMAKKYRGISKQNLDIYTKTYELIQNHRYYDDAGRVLDVMSVALGTCRGGEYYNGYNAKLAELIQAAA